jgi:carbonic anhydrase
MDRLIEGVSKFQRDVYPQYRELFKELAHAQLPETLFITCADSRIVPDLITQSKPGELFICRNAGNMVPAYGEVHGGVSATIEYAVTVLPIRDIVVCGHTGCGAIKALMHPEQAASMPTVQSWLNHGEVARRMVEDHHKNLPEDQKLRRLTEENVIAQLANLRTHPSVASRLRMNAVRLHGWIYDIGTGHIDAFAAEVGRFVPVEEYAAALQARDALQLAS